MSHIINVLMVFSGGRANDPGNKVPGPPAILGLPWPYQGSQLNLEKESEDGLVIERQHFVFLRRRRPLSGSRKAGLSVARTPLLRTHNTPLGLQRI